MYSQRKERINIIYIFQLFLHSVTFILITVPLYRRNFCDGHIILVFIIITFNGNYFLKLYMMHEFVFSVFQQSCVIDTLCHCAWGAGMTQFFPFSFSFGHTTTSLCSKKKKFLKRMYA